MTKAPARQARAADQHRRHDRLHREILRRHKLEPRIRRNSSTRSPRWATKA